MGNYAKAYAGGLGGAVSVLVLYGLHQIPFVQQMPPEVSAAMQFIVTTAITAGLVYIAPANKPAA